MKKMIEEINTILQENLIIYPSQTLLCTVSSGQDSILLFFVFLHLKTQWNLNLALTYCHHFWQRTNFFSFWQIWKIAFIFQLPCFLVLAEITLSTENQARNWRQKSVERVALLQNSSEIAFGHTASDKLETALWHLIRGSSPNGLNCIKQTNFSKTTFVHIFFSVQPTKSFKGKKTDFKEKKKCVSFWSFPKKFFEFLKKLNQFNQESSDFSSAFLPNNLITQVENSENVSQKFYFKKEKKSLGFSPLDNVIFFSFCLKKITVIPVFKKLRPLSNLHREDVLKFIEHYLLPVIPDPTNAFSNLSRSKIRNQVIPSIRYLFQSNFDLACTQFLNILENESCDSEQGLKKIHQTLLTTLFLYNLRIDHSQKKINLSLLIRYKFKKLPISLQSKIVKKIFFNYSSSQLNFSQIETLRFFILSKKPLGQKKPNRPTICFLNKKRKVDN